MMVYHKSFEAAYADICHAVNRNFDFECSPRGQKIREKLAYSFTLEDPRNRLLNNVARDANYGFAVGEFLWYWQGRTDLHMMQYYNKRMKAFSDDGLTLNSAYGYRLRTGSDMLEMDSQWNYCVQTLRDDPDSRRAVMTILSPMDIHIANTRGSKDVPCTLSLQFFIRENQLHMHAVMRSNDVFWGLTFDAFSFSLFQECMLMDLRRHDKFRELQLGSYTHTAGSMHIYERHFDQAEKVVDEFDKNMIKQGIVPMPPLSSFESLEELCHDEQLLRKKGIQAIDLGKYRDGERWMAARLNEHRAKRDREVSNEQQLQGAAPAGS